MGIRKFTPPHSFLPSRHLHLRYSHPEPINPFNSTTSICFVFVLFCLFGSFYFYFCFRLFRFGLRAFLFSSFSVLSLRCFFFCLSWPSLNPVWPTTNGPVREDTKLS